MEFLSLGSWLTRLPDCHVIPRKTQPERERHSLCVPIVTSRCHYCPVTPTVFMDNMDTMCCLLFTIGSPLWDTNLTDLIRGTIQELWKHSN
ncbi:hypothetical protein GDO86_006913 [Hymenochirus boettgeri]|uniref:Uncharacterized protein n=1 Tax=Hymenochirus boettgeri TaxID=247094 RepID=A0A8T2JCR2_9PIPI|nr:hypothetical protein GDO86_006913 [Hymenochirus boettgeri]